VCKIKKLRLFFLKVSPVLADKSDVFELKMVEKFPQNQAVELMSVMGGICVLVRLSKTNKIRNDNPVSSSHKRWDHLPVEKRPSGLSMETKNHRTILWSLVEIVHPRQGHPATSLYRWEGV